MLEVIIDSFGIATIIFLFMMAFFILKSYIVSILRKQKKIKCLCKHEYEPYSAFYFGGVEYEFKCRKCGKVISVKTVTDDTFNWVKDD